MKDKNRFIVIMAILGIVLVSGCVDEKEEPVIPQQEFCVKEGTGEKLSLTEARQIASASGCGEQGELKDTAVCNKDTGTWWIDMDIKKEGCNPACVIDVATKQAKLNWRCMGVIIEGPEETLSVSELLRNPVYGTEVEVQGEVSSLGELQCPCFELTSDGGKIQVWYNLMMEDNETERPPVSVEGIRNGDWVTVTGELKSAGGPGSLNDFWASDIKKIDDPDVRLSNPAAIYCVEQEGEVLVMDTAGGQEGYCVLPDGRRCELWGFYSSKGGECIPMPDEDLELMDDEEEP